MFANLLALTTIFLMMSCSGKDTIASRAEHFVRVTYGDVDRILHVKVDTVTYGDKLDERMEQARRSMEFSAMMKRSYSGDVRDESFAKDKAWVEALDSLKGASGDILGDPAAFTCVVVYNNPSNLVWVQLDRHGNLLNITKEIGKLLMNPGDDVPGYAEAWEKHHTR